MTDSTVSLAVEWARWGMDPGIRGGYHLLACSEGRISSRNFDEILARFNPGSLDELPQVTVSYVPAGDGSRYLGMAIHEAEVSGADRLGRDVVATRYFCIPYQAAAVAAVSYTAMYEALREIQPVQDDRSVCTVELAGAMGGVPADVNRALPVVGLLLTGNPVCIVDAEATGMAERLAYIDAIMSLLPYGMRAEMAASTWTRGTYRGHRFRLFFSDAPRRSSESGLDDHVVRWRSDHVLVAEAPHTKFEPAVEYLSALRQQLDSPTLGRLASATEPLQFNAEAGFRALSHIKVLDAVAAARTDAPGEQRLWRPRKTKESRAPAVSDSARAPRAAEAERAEELLLACVQAVGDGSRNVKQHVSQLEGILQAAEIPDAEQQRHLHHIFGTSPRLMRVLSIGKQRISFYHFLVRLSSSRTIDYQGYCLIEDILGGYPDRALLEAIDEWAAEDPVVKLLVSDQLGERRPAGGLRQLIGMAVDPDVRPAHARIICDRLIDELDSASETDIEDALPLLRQHGYLAPALSAREPEDLGYQVEMLMSLLAALFSGTRNGDLYRDVTITSGWQARTVALLLAVLCLTNESTADVGVSFMAGLARAPGLSDSLRDVLARRGFKVNASDAARHPGPSQRTDDYSARIRSNRQAGRRDTLGALHRPLNPDNSLSADLRGEDYEGEEG